MLRHYEQDHEENDKESNMQNSTDRLQRIYQSPEIEVGHKRKKDKRPHDHRYVPAFWGVIGVVEDDQGRENICCVRGHAAHREQPYGYSDPT